MIFQNLYDIQNILKQLKSIKKHLPRIPEALIRISSTIKQKDTKRNKKNLAESWLSVLEPGGQPDWT